jgi:hypothetical protein
VARQVDRDEHHEGEGANGRGEKPDELPTMPLVRH